MFGMMKGIVMGILIRGARNMMILIRVTTIILGQGLNYDNSYQL